MAFFKRSQMLLTYFSSMVICERKKTIQVKKVFHKKTTSLQNDNRQHLCLRHTFQPQHLTKVCNAYKASNTHTVYNYTYCRFLLFALLLSYYFPVIPYVKYSVTVCITQAMNEGEKAFQNDFCNFLSQSATDANVIHIGTIMYNVFFKSFPK